jgi:hypothetical protein
MSRVARYTDGSHRIALRVEFTATLRQIASILAVEHEFDYPERKLTRSGVMRLVRDHFWLHGVIEIDVDSEEAYDWAVDEVCRLWPVFEGDR